MALRWQFHYCVMSINVLCALVSTKNCIALMCPTPTLTLNSLNVQHDLGTWMTMARSRIRTRGKLISYPISYPISYLRSYLTSYPIIPDASSFSGGASGTMLKHKLRPENAYFRAHDFEFILSSFLLASMLTISVLPQCHNARGRKTT
jgi:hypothetical protein